ncbi:MAG: VTT domain-containing protein [Saprospiraceae bacterium]|nr:VTT domain-containing protein [Saprospiraceae bacterium]
MTDFQELIEQFSYLGIFLWFAFFDQITPIPEELVLITMGFIANQGHIHPLLAGLTALGGLIVVDNVYYGLGKSGKFLFNRLRKTSEMEMMERFKKRIVAHDWQTIFMMSYFPKLRFITPFLAAAAGIKWLRFAIINAASSATYVTLYILLGIFFEHQLESIKLEMLMIYITVFTLIIGIIVFIWIFRKPLHTHSINQENKESLKP